MAKILSALKKLCGFFCPRKRRPYEESILLVGCGRMGGALLEGFLAKIPAHKITVVEPSADTAKVLKESYNVNVVKGINEKFFEISQFSTIIFAVKPQVMESILPLFKHDNLRDSVFISIAAGKKVEFFEKFLGKKAQIIRTMPNLPALVREGATVAVANKNVDKETKELTAKLFSSVGEFYWVEDESMLDAVTAISGSGPAYVFHFIECLVRSAVNLGLPDDLAKSLAYSTIVGSARLAKESDKTAYDLKVQVTSPGGTTEAALKVLESKEGLGKIMQEATEAACKRSKELA